MNKSVFEKFVKEYLEFDEHLFDSKDKIKRILKLLEDEKNLELLLGNELYKRKYILKVLDNNNFSLCPNTSYRIEAIRNAQTPEETRFNFFQGALGVYLNEKRQPLFKKYIDELTEEEFDHSYKSFYAIERGLYDSDNKIKKIHNEIQCLKRKKILKKEERKNLEYLKKHHEEISKKFEREIKILYSMAKHFNPTECEYLALIFEEGNLDEELRDLFMSIPKENREFSWCPPNISKEIMKKFCKILLKLTPEMKESLKRDEINFFSKNFFSDFQITKLINIMHELVEKNVWFINIDKENIEHPILNLLVPNSDYYFEEQMLSINIDNLSFIKLYIKLKASNDKALNKKDLHFLENAKLELMDLMSDILEIRNESPELFEKKEVYAILHFTNKKDLEYIFNELRKGIDLESVLSNTFVEKIVKCENLDNLINLINNLEKENSSLCYMLGFSSEENLGKMNKEELKKFIENFYNTNVELFKSKELFRKLFEFLTKYENLTLLISLEDELKKDFILKSIINSDLKSDEINKKISLIIDAKTDAEAKYVFSTYKKENGLESELERLYTIFGELSHEDFNKRYRGIIRVAREIEQRRKLIDFNYEVDNKGVEEKLFGKSRYLKKLAKLEELAQVLYTIARQFSSFPFYSVERFLQKELLEGEALEAYLSIPEKIFEKFNNNLLSYGLSDLVCPEDYTGKKGFKILCELFSLVPEGEEDIIFEILDEDFCYRTFEILHIILFNNIWNIDVPEVSDEEACYINYRIEKHPILKSFNRENKEYKDYSVLKNNIENIEFLKFYINYKQYPNFYNGLFHSDIEFLGEVKQEYFKVTLRILLVIRNNPNMFDNIDINKLLDATSLTELNLLLRDLKHILSEEEYEHMPFVNLLEKENSIEKIMELLNEIEGDTLTAGTLIKTRKIKQ